MAAEGSRFQGYRSQGFIYAINVLSNPLRQWVDIGKLACFANNAYSLLTSGDYRKLALLQVDAH